MDNILIGIAVFLVSAVIFTFVGMYIRKKIAESKMESAEAQAKKIIEMANVDAENKKKEEIFKAKEEIMNARKDLDQEIRERRGEVQNQERRLIQKEENLERKQDIVEKKEKDLDKKYQELDNKKAEVQDLFNKQMSELQRIAGMSKEEAKKVLLAEFDKQLTVEKANLLRDMEAKVKDAADKNAKEVIGYAIQKCAADHTSETTVSIVTLPNDDMKGRIIGREGRNIKALETLTGIDLIIDDTAKEEVANVIKEEGERAVMETGVIGLHPDLVKLIGKLKYRTSYGQNVLNHSIEVSNLARIMAEELGLDAKLARRAGLLHDIGKALDHDMEGTHVELGVEVLKKYKENENVINAVQAHHGDVEPKTIEAVLVQAADAISASRPGARRETLEAYIKRLEQLEGIADSFEGVEKSFAIQAGREIRIIVKPDKIDDNQMKLMARDIAKRVEDEMEYPGQIKVNVVRETRVIDYAK